MSNIYLHNEENNDSDSEENIVLNDCMDSDLASESDLTRDDSDFEENI